MAKAKKYEYRVVQDNNSWAAEIVRRVTSSKTVVSKSHTGFATESDAQEWGQRELKLFLQKLSERNENRAK